MHNHAGPLPTSSSDIACPCQCCNLKWNALLPPSRIPPYLRSTIVVTYTTLICTLFTWLALNTLVAKRSTDPFKVPAIPPLHLLVPALSLCSSTFALAANEQTGDMELASILLRSVGSKTGSFPLVKCRHSELSESGMTCLVFACPFTARAVRMNILYLECHLQSTNLSN